MYAGRAAGSKLKSLLQADLTPEHIEVRETVLIKNSSYLPRLTSISFSLKPSSSVFVFFLGSFRTFELSSFIKHFVILTLAQQEKDHHSVMTRHITKVNQWGYDKDHAKRLAEMLPVN